MLRMNPLMDAESLTGESRSYLLGLYLADGNLNGNKIRSNTVRYTLQRNEGDIAGRIETLLRSVHLKPLIYHQKSRGSIVVCATSTNLQQFFPEKECLLADEELRRRFFEKNDLFNRDNRVAFVAGLMDGDGTCRTYLNRGEIKRGGAPLERSKSNGFSPRRGFHFCWISSKSLSGRLRRIL